MSVLTNKRGRTDILLLINKKHVCLINKYEVV